MRTDAARKEAKRREQQEDFDPTVIDEAIAQHKLLRAPKEGKCNRGRKETRADIYINVSQAKIADLKKQLEEGEKTLSYEEKRLLRNRKSALENRVKTKLQKETLQRDMNAVQTKFRAIAEELFKEIPASSRRRVMNRIAEKYSSGQQGDKSRPSKVDFVSTLCQHMGFD